MDNRCREWDLSGGSVARAVNSRSRMYPLVIVPHNQPLVWGMDEFLLEG
ncbi:hypothetical protein HAPAU_39900 [Halalkalicoccus paucihalophilus]|uniref:Uncharacterized protein n=1 Tax=Halalkalicoccus paucihalophilus TaxID=1008153 RepID=A0A151A8B0_9EURY|nr:hypothetical protein HAPAU_39900 [Halalkalicoccus paucihalophilus]